MSYHLVVTSEFGGHPRGAVLTDAMLIETVLASEDAAKVVRINPPAAPAPAAVGKE
jgi:hypothetical protein